MRARMAGRYCASRLCSYCTYRSSLGRLGLSESAISWVSMRGKFRFRLQSLLAVYDVGVNRYFM